MAETDDIMEAVKKEAVDLVRNCNLLHLCMYGYE